MQTKGAAFDKKTAISVGGSKVKDSEAVVRDWVKGALEIINEVKFYYFV